MYVIGNKGTTISVGFEGLIVGVNSRHFEFATQVFNEADADSCYEKPLTP